VTALDYSEAMLETCRAKKEQDPNGARVTLLEGSIFELPFEDDSFDRVLCVHVLMHLPEHEQGLAEIVRVLKPGGIAVFDIRNTWSINRVAYPLRRLAQRLQSREPWYVWYASVADVRRLAARLGAEVVRTRGLFPIKPNKMRGAMARFVEALEQAPDGAFSRRIGHIQMIALRKVQASR
jgi:SAM-dependent methyltransferase